MDHILYWNDVALEANRRDFSFLPGTTEARPEQGGPTLSSRALAIVHLATYDAHAGAQHNPPGLPAYLTGLPAAGGGASEAQAVAYAAHGALSALFPRQRPHFDAALAASGVATAAPAPGKDFGLAVADAILRDRGGDPGAGDAGYRPSPLPGRHRVDPVNPDQGFHAPYYGAASKCFAVTARHELLPPYVRGNAEYRRALRQVRGKGCRPDLMGALPSGLSKRTVDETIVGLFWAYDGPNGLGTPPRLYNLIVRQVALQKGNDADQNARLFALVNAAMGDAGILAWDQKYVHDLWRPVLGIREHDDAMGPDAAATPTANLDDDCDPSWLPLGAPHSNSTKRDFTPPFPAYPSGHATFGAAALHVVRLFYGTPAGNRAPDAHFPGTLVSEELDGATTDTAGVVRPRHTRAFPGGLWQMIEENGFSRVYLGVHWFFDAFALAPDGRPNLAQNIGGVPLGLKIAEDLFSAGGGRAPKKSAVGPRA